MRFMLTFRVPMDEGNAGIKDGSLGQTLQTIIDELKPEAAYFGPIEGARGGYFVVNFDEPSQIPAIAEPLFLGLSATIQISPVFTPEELPTETLQLVGGWHVHVMANWWARSISRCLGVFDPAAPPR